MPRLNIEDKWWVDPRRFALAKKMGSKYAADGLALAAWKISQQFWGQGRKKVPYCMFTEMDQHELLFEVGLAVKRGGFVYVRGTSQFHDWYASSLERSSKGGKSLRKTPKLTRSYRGATAESLPLPLPLPLPLKKEEEEEEKEDFLLIESTKGSRTGVQAKPEIKSLVDEWGKTLKYFNNTRDPHLDEVVLYRLMQKHGEARARAAITGMRHEQRTESFDPARHISASRLNKHFEKFETLGTRQESSKTRKAEV